MAGATWNLQRCGVGLLEPLCEGLELAIDWDLLLLQEVYTPGAEERETDVVGGVGAEVGVDDDVDVLVARELRGHQAVLGGVVLHRRRVGGIRAMATRQDATGVAFTNVAGDTILALSLQIPTAWEPTEAFAKGLDKLSELLGESSSLRKLRTIAGGDFNFELADTDAARHELMSQLAEGCGLGIAAAPAWTDAWRHPGSGTLAHRCLDG